MNATRSLTFLLITCGVLMVSGCPKPKTKTPMVPPSVRSYLSESANAGMEGDRSQSSGDWSDALEKYEAVVHSGNAALLEYQRLGIAFENQHWLAYFLPAQGHYDAARMQMQLEYPATQVNQHLQAAHQAITAAISLDQVTARANGQDHTPSAWKLFYFRANIASMLGDLTSARSDYQEVARNLNRGFQPAVDQLAYIDYLEGRNSSDRSPGGLPFPKKPQLLSTKTKVDLIFTFSKYVFKEYAEEIGLAKNIADALMQ